MWKAIISRARGSDKFPEVGMNDRMFLSGKSKSFIIRRAQEFDFVGGKSYRVRVEFYTEATFYSDKPQSVVFTAGNSR